MIDRRLGWGMYPRIYCYTEAYESITGKRGLNLFVSQPWPLALLLFPHPFQQDKV